MIRTVLLSANWRPSHHAVWRRTANSCWWGQRVATSTCWTQASSSWANTSSTRTLSCRSKSTLSLCLRGCRQVPWYTQNTC